MINPDTLRDEDRKSANDFISQYVESKIAQDEWAPDVYGIMRVAYFAGLERGRESVAGELGIMDENLIARDTKIGQLTEKLAAAEMSLKYKSLEVGRSEHRGNTVDYVYDKCIAYGKQIDELVRKLAAAEKRDAEMLDHAVKLEALNAKYKAALEKITMRPKWYKDSGHTCDSKADLQSVHTIATEALKPETKE